MALPPELAALLREIKGVRSPVRRMKLLSRAWRHLRALTPLERRQIALQAGLGQFDPILERLGRKEDGIVPDEVTQALEGMDDLDPSKVGQLVRDLRDPRRRKDLARRGLDLLRTHLAKEEAATPGPPEPDEAAEPAPVPEPVAVRIPPPPAPVQPTAVQRPAPPPAPAKPSAVRRPAPPQRGTADPEAGPPVAAPTRPSGARAEQSPLPRPSPDARPAHPVPPPVPVPTPAPVAARRPEPPAPLPSPAPEAEPRTPPRDEAAALAEQVAAAPSLTVRFRLVRRFLAAGGRLEVGSIRNLLASFPEGWPRRRVLIALLERGMPRVIDDALSLIADLDRPADQRWCAAELLASRELSAEQAQRLHERIPLSSPRRRESA
jgi:hypothetical protein